MDIICNFPSFSIMLCLFAGIVSSVLKRKAARALNTILIVTVEIMNICVLFYTIKIGKPIVYQMGNFPAPWGNELRIGVLEAVMAQFFCVIMLLSMLGGRKKLDEEVDKEKHNLYYVLINLLLSSLLALVYTNDLFTAYVFVEINTSAEVVNKTLKNKQLEKNCQKSQVILSSICQKSQRKVKFESVSHGGNDSSPRWKRAFLTVVTIVPHGGNDSFS